MWSTTLHQTLNELICLSAVLCHKYFNPSLTASYKQDKFQAAA